MVVGTNFEKIVGLILGQSFAPSLMDRPNRLWPMQRAVHPNMVRESEMQWLAVGSEQALRRAEASANLRLGQSG